MLLCHSPKMPLCGSRHASAISVAVRCPRVGRKNENLSIQSTGASVDNCQGVLLAHLQRLHQCSQSDMITRLLGQVKSQRGVPVQPLGTQSISLSTSACSISCARARISMALIVVIWLRVKVERILTG